MQLTWFEYRTNAIICQVQQLLTVPQEVYDGFMQNDTQKVILPELGSMTIDQATVIRFHMENTRRREQQREEEQEIARKIGAKALERPQAAWQYANPEATAAAAAARRRQQMLYNRLEDANEIV